MRLFPTVPLLLICRNAERQGVEMLDNHFRLSVVVSVFRWRAAFLSSEDTIEVTHIVISALKAYLGDGLGGVYQHACGISHAYVDDVIAKPAACVQLEKAAECALAHVG